MLVTEWLRADQPERDHEVLIPTPLRGDGAPVVNVYPASDFCGKTNRPSSYSVP